MVLLLGQFCCDIFLLLVYCGLIDRMDGVALSLCYHSGWKMDGFDVREY